MMAKASLVEEGADAGPFFHELTERQVRSRFGDLVVRAESAFRQDPQYLVEMVQQASILVYKRGLWAAKSRSAPDGDVRDEMDAQGVLVPMRGQRARRRSNSV